MLRKFNFLLLLRQFVVNISTRNIDQVVSMLFFHCRSNANEHTLTKLWFSTDYQCWSNIGSSTLHRLATFFQRLSDSNDWPVWLNGWVFVYELSDCGFESLCCHFNFRCGACFVQGVPWHSGKLHSVYSLWNSYVTW